MLTTSALFRPSLPPALSQSAIPQASQIVNVPVVPQPVLQTVATPLVQPVIQPTVAPALVQSLVQPVSVVQPLAVAIPPPPPKPLTPSPQYDKFIPPTPMPQSLANDMPPKVYQFYQYVPVQANTPVNVSLQQAPAYSTVSTPIQTVAYTVGVPQYNTITYI